jgi:pimeloyl-ACP methyl ester carboxylesterase
VPEVSDHNGEIDAPSGAQVSLPVFWRSAAVERGPGAAVASSSGGETEAAVPLYLHGVPDSSDQWLGFLACSGGLAPDLPGFGRSGKPGSLSFTIEEYADFIESFLALVGVERVQLVVHDWGAVGLAFAQRHPERIERLVVINAVPFLPGYRWHRTARIWRTPVLGELSMGSINRRVLRLISRESNATPGPMPDSWIDSVLAHFDQGTQRAILRLYRSSPPERLAAAGERLGELRVPALVVWGTRDPYIPARFGKAYADVLGGELLELADAGHWAWIDRPDAIDRVVEFLGGASG